LERLERALEARRPDLQRFEAFYIGNHPLQFATTKFRETFGNQFGAFADNWCQLVVDATVERLKVEGIRFGSHGPDADKDAWKIWQANGLDADSNLAHLEAVKCGESYLLVAPPAEDGGEPVITVEHPAHVIVAHAPANHRNRLAALKKWLADDGYARATVYLPDGLHKFRSVEKYAVGRQIQWRRADEGFVANPLGVVPMIPLRNNPSLMRGGQSDLQPAIPIQTAIDKIVTDMIVASEFAAFRQRYATGLEVPVDENGNPLPSFLSSVSRMWTVEASDVKFGEFEASDLTNYVKAVEMLVQHLAAQTRTPPHYLLGQSGNFPSGESLKATETGLVAKVQRKQVDFGEAYEDAMRLAFRLKGDSTRGKAIDAEVIWRDPESRSWGELVDGLLKLQALGVPNEVLWSRAGFTPQEIDRMRGIWAERQASMPAMPPMPPETPQTANGTPSVVDPTAVGRPPAR
jgi:hypothetical protein